MNYAFKSHPTVYQSVLFRSRLEAKWAAFFDLWKIPWQYEPVDLEDWTPDFLIELPCYHRQCHGCHRIMVEVKPYHSVQQFEVHPCLRYVYGTETPYDGLGLFGNHPNITRLLFKHAGNLTDCKIAEWPPDELALIQPGGERSTIYSIETLTETTWNLAGSKVQYKPSHPYSLEPHLGRIEAGWREPE